MSRDIGEIASEWVVFEIKQFDILTIGDLCADLVMMGDDLVPGFSQEEKLVDGYALRMGGSCSIFASQAARLGLRVGLIGVVGDDAFADLILDTLEESGVDTSLVLVDPQVQTGLSVHLQQPDDRSILTYLGTITSVLPEHVSTELLHSTRHLHVGSYFLLPQLQAAFPTIVQEVKKAGGTVSLDTNWDPEEKWDRGLGQVLDYTDVFIPNEQELPAITRTHSIWAGLEKLKERIPIVAVKMGGDGALVQEGEALWRATVPEAEVVDTIGAGDSFDAGFLYGFLQGRPVEECLAIASACGSATVRAAGGTAGQLWEKDLAEWVPKIQIALAKSKG